MLASLWPVGLAYDAAEACAVNSASMALNSLSASAMGEPRVARRRRCRPR